MKVSLGKVAKLFGYPFTLSAKSGISGSSRVPSISGWLARIWSTSVEPDLGRLTMKIGSSAATPQPWPCLVREPVQYGGENRSRLVKSIDRRQRRRFGH